MSAPGNGFGPQGPDDEVRELMEKAGARPEIDSEDLARIKAAAREVWQRKFGTLPQDEKEKARQIRFLQSRGFGLDVIFQVLRGGSGE